MHEDILSARQNKNLLFDFYGALLTEKQQEIFTMYTAEDCSLTEIGMEFGITPQGVADFVKRATKQLEKYEESLGLVKKFLSQQHTLEAIYAQLDKLNGAEDAGPVCAIKDLLNKLMI